MRTPAIVLLLGLAAAAACTPGGPLPQERSPLEDALTAGDDFLDRKEYPKATAEADRAISFQISSPAASSCASSAFA